MAGYSGKAAQGGKGKLDNDKFLVGVPSKVMVVMVVWDIGVVGLVREVR